MVGLLGKFWDRILEKPQMPESQALKQQPPEPPEVPERRITRKIILIKKKPKHEQEGWEAVLEGSLHKWNIEVPACDDLLEICSC